MLKKSIIVLLTSLLPLFIVPVNSQLTQPEKQFLEIKNIISRNPGGENKTIGWSETGGGTLSSNTTAANVSFGNAAISYDASAASDFVSTNAYTIPAGMFGQSCLAKISYKGGDSNLTFRVTDGTNTLASEALTAATTYLNKTLSFICPSSGTLQLDVVASADAAIVYLDEAYIGKNYLINNVSQAQFVGSVYFATTASCSWTRTNTVLGAFSTTAACPGPTVEASGSGGWTIATTDADLPKITINNLPPGIYQIIYSMEVETATAAAEASFAVNDGTTSSGYTARQINVAAAGPSVTGSAYFSYTTSGNRTFEIYGASNTGALALQNDTNNERLNFFIVRWPLSSETSFRVDEVAWKVDANISGANIDIGTADVATYSGIENASLTLTQNSGSITAQIPCSSTNAPSGTTCSAGSESVGVAFTVPKAGDVLACASFQHHTTLGASGVVDTTFQIVETPSNAQTISQEGKTRLGGLKSGASGATLSYPFRVCGIFTFASSGLKVLRLFYEQDTTATISSNLVLADAAAAAGQRDIHWEVYPLNIQTPAPLIVNSVVSSSSGVERIERATITNGGSCAIDSQTGSWLSSVSFSSTGNCDVNITTGKFIAVPTCVVSPKQPSVVAFCGTSAAVTPTTTTRRIYCVNDAGTAINTAFEIICMGAR